MGKLLLVNDDGYNAPGIVLVEEILKDYGYTEDEIKEVMEDLKNFRGMDD